jgi:Domain of unknown function (DUF4148)
MSARNLSHTLTKLAALAGSALILGNASAAKSWHQPDFVEAKPAVEKTRAQVREETVAYLAAGGKKMASGEASLNYTVKLNDRPRAEVVAELRSVQYRLSHQNAERFEF